MIPVILGVTILIFTILYFIPGDPVRLLLGVEPTPAQVEAKREAMGLNDPYLVRLGKYVEGIVLHFDFGKSWISRCSSPCSGSPCQTSGLP
jgi:peptide/nickel transport system permease protein